MYLFILFKTCHIDSLGRQRDESAHVSRIEVASCVIYCSKRVCIYVTRIWNPPDICISRVCIVACYSIMLPHSSNQCAISGRISSLFCYMYNAESGIWSFYRMFMNSASCINCLFMLSCAKCLFISQSTWYPMPFCIFHSFHIGFYTVRDLLYFIKFNISSALCDSSSDYSLYLSLVPSFALLCDI